MKKRILLIIIILVIIISFIISYFVLNNNYSSVIIIDTNIGYEIYLDENENIVKYIRYEDNKKKVVRKRNSLDNIFDLIRNESKEYYYDETALDIVMSGKNILDLQSYEHKLNQSTEINYAVRYFGIPNEEDIELANKYVITTAKASLVNSVSQKVQEIPVSKLVNKTIKELLDMEHMEMYCSDEYMLEGGRCIKKVETAEPLIGMLCPVDYYEYNGICYRLGEDRPGNKLMCHSNFKLVDDECIYTETHDGEGVCEKGEYNGKECVYMEEKGEPKEYCYDPNRYLYNHKCLATKPLLNGGCPGSGNSKMGNKCVNMKDDMQDPSYSCEKGEILYSQGAGVFKCIVETKYKVLGYNCGPDVPIQTDKKCIRIEKEAPFIEKICINGSTLVDENTCIIKSETTDKVERQYCEGYAKLKNNVCIVYEDIAALKSE